MREVPVAGALTGAIASWSSPPDAPKPATALGWPSYVRAHAFAAVVPPSCVPLQKSVPLPTPRSEARPTRLSLLTWMLGSPAVFVPHPAAPTVWACGCPTLNDDAPEVAPGECLPPALVWWPLAPAAGRAVARARASPVAVAAASVWVRMRVLQLGSTAGEMPALPHG